MTTQQADQVIALLGRIASAMDPSPARAVQGAGRAMQAFEVHCASLEVSPSLLSQPCRARWLHDARMVIAAKMIQEGWTQTQIGACMGRTPSTIHYTLQTWHANRNLPTLKRLWAKLSATTESSPDSPANTLTTGGLNGERIAASRG